MRLLPFVAPMINWMVYLGEQSMFCDHYHDCSDHYCSYQYFHNTTMFVSDDSCNLKNDSNNVIVVATMNGLKMYSNRDCDCLEPQIVDNDRYYSTLTMIMS